MKIFVYQLIQLEGNNGLDLLDHPVWFIWFLALMSVCYISCVLFSKLSRLSLKCNQNLTFPWINSSVSSYHRGKVDRFVKLQERQKRQAQHAECWAKRNKWWWQLSFLHRNRQGWIKTLTNQRWGFSAYSFYSLD